MTPFLETVRAYRQGARTLPGRYYTSPHVFAEEAERIFARSWLCAGREADVPEPGSYVLAQVAGESLILVRGDDGVARAFYNVCRHRGTRLLEQPAGRLGRALQCPYHAWTYALDGRLVGAPQMEGVADFDRADYPLHPVALEAWQGFLFVNLDPRPEPLAGTYAPLAERVRRFDLARLRSWRRVTYEVRANWKLVVQNYSECLHCPVIHPRLVERTPWRSGENDLTEGPFLGGFMTLTEGTGGMTMSGRSCGPPVGDLLEEDRRRVYYYSVFPNLLLSLHADYVMAHTLWPEGSDRTRVVCEWLFHPAAFDSPDHDPEDGVRFWDATNREDWHVCELSQQGIASRAYAPGPYSPRESIPAAWDREYLSRLGAGVGGLS